MVIENFFRTAEETPFEMHLNKCCESEFFNCFKCVLDLQGAGTFLRRMKPIFHVAR